MSIRVSAEAMPNHRFHPEPPSLRSWAAGEAGRYAHEDCYEARPDPLALFPRPAVSTARKGSGASVRSSSSARVIMTEEPGAGKPHGCAGGAPGNRCFYYDASLRIG